MNSFVYNGLGAHVLFGQGSLSRLGEMVDRLGAKRALLLSTPEQAAQAAGLAELPGTRVVARFDRAAMHTPVEITEQAVSLVSDQAIDVTLAFGGGSTIGLAKAITLRTGIPQIAIPTTYAGSEMTPILGQTEKGRKTTLRDAALLPKAVLYDVDLTLSLPVGLSGTSGLNAIAHSVEGLYAQDSNPVMQLLAEEGIRALAAALPIVALDPANRDARSDALYGAWLCGMVLGSVGMALHHKLCHTLGGSFGLPHAETHAVILPHALAYSAPMIPEAMVRLRRALNTDDPAQALFDLARKVGAPASLQALGMPESGIATAAQFTLENPYWNPRMLESAPITRLLGRAWSGQPPEIEGIASR